MIDVYRLLTAIFIFGLITLVLLIVIFAAYFFRPNKYFKVKAGVRKKKQN